jgi:hypothetical protein
MTQRMSTANTNTDSQSHRRDPQLVRSQDPNYVSALEQHQAGIDRMLARQNPQHAAYETPDHGVSTPPERTSTG